MKSFTFSFFFIISFLLLFSCQGNYEASQKLETADCLMETDPDSSLQIINSISEHSLNTQELKAQYALLKTICLFKNDSNPTSFNILKPALYYYPKQGSSNDKLRTYYYEGRIHLCQNNENEALRSFTKALDYKANIKDSLVLARLLTSISSIMAHHTKINDEIKYCLEAADIYKKCGHDRYTMKTYARILEAASAIEEKNLADSIAEILNKLHVQTGSTEFYITPYLTYLLTFASNDDISKFIIKYPVIEKNEDIILYAEAYNRIGNNNRALEYIEQFDTTASERAAFKYWAMKYIVADSIKQYKDALTAYKRISSDVQWKEYCLINSDDLLITKEHELEVEKNLMVAQRDNIILFCCGIGVLLLLIVIWLYYHKRLAKTKRGLLMEENKNLRLQTHNMVIEKENLELQNQKQILESENLKERLNKLEEESHHLKDLLCTQMNEMDHSIREIIQNRMQMLNAIIRKEINFHPSFDKSYEAWIENIRKDNEGFLNDTKLAYLHLYPTLKEYFTEKNLSDTETKVFCLYAMGFRGKEIGNYLNTRSHYNVSSEIRRKLGLLPSDTNLGNYIRDLIKRLK